MIVDIHTHIFPPQFIARRDVLAATETAFGDVYVDPRAKMATAEDLLASMDAAGVDVSVACGFWWDDPALAAEHADYLVESARRSGGRILAFVPTFAVAPGAAGVGETRIEDPSTFPGGDLQVLAHCTEGPGHEYHGKAGGLSPGGLWRLLESHPTLRVVAAHWGGGFPFYGLMPEVREVIDGGRLLLDTAASAYLYRPEVFGTAIDLVGAGAIAWGSDFPLRPQALDLAEARAAIDEPAAREAILGTNAARFLGLE